MLKQVQHDIFGPFPITTQSLGGEGWGEGEFKIILERKEIKWTFL
jgi:hypothetical protein